MSQAEKTVGKIAAHPTTAAARMMRVFVRDLVLSARIGVYQHEKLGTQRVRINLELVCTEHPAIKDELNNVVNYADLVEQVRAIVDEGHINLVETLADRVAEACRLYPLVLRSARPGFRALQSAAATQVVW